MEDANGEKDLEAQEKQQELSTPENKNPYFDTSGSDSDEEYEFTCEICNKTFSGLKPLRQHEKGARHLKRVQKKKLEKKLLRKLEDESTENNEDDDLDQTLFAVCKTCKKDFMNPESFEMHLKSHGHKKKMAASKLLKEIKDEDGHISLEKLKQKRKENKPKKGVTIVVGKTSATSEEHTGENSGATGYSGPQISSNESSDDDEITETQEFECLECKKVFTGVNPWYQHLISKVHEKALKQKELFDKLRITETSSAKESSTAQYLVQEDDVISCRLCNVALTGPESASAHLKSRKHTKKLELKKWKKSMKENRENSSKVKKRAYSEPSDQNILEMRNVTLDEETTRREIDNKEEKQEFSKSEELSFDREEYESVLNIKPSLTTKPDTYSESSKENEDSSSGKRVTDQDLNKDSSEGTVSQDNLQSFQETYI